VEGKGGRGITRLGWEKQDGYMPTRKTENYVDHSREGDNYTGGENARGAAVGNPDKTHLNSCNIKKGTDYAAESGLKKKKSPHGRERGITERFYSSYKWTQQGTF